MEKIKSQFMKRRPLQLWISLTAFVVLIVGLILSLQPWRTISSVNIDSNMLTKQQVQKYVGINDKTPRWRVLGQTTFIAHQLIKKMPKFILLILIWTVMSFQSKLLKILVQDL